MKLLRSDISCCRYESPLGTMLLSATECALTGAWFVGQKHFPAVYSHIERHTELLRYASDWLDAYFRGEQPTLNLPLAPEGSAFQQEVWALLRQIPYGETVTYGELAARIEQNRGSRCSARAVGSAVGRNPISILIPCHRVIGANGSLTGYAGGLERKQTLLALERREQPAPADSMHMSEFT